MKYLSQVVKGNLIEKGKGNKSNATIEKVAISQRYFMKLNNCDRTENFLNAEKIFFDALIKSYSKEITKQERLKNKSDSETLTRRK